MHRTEKLVSKLLSAGLAALIAAGAAWGTWRDMQPKFRDLTIHAGGTMPVLADFATEYAVAEKCVAVTDLSGITSGDAGIHEIVLRCGSREETVTLTIQDAVAPELEVQDLELFPGTELKVEDVVTHVWDHTQVTLSFDREYKEPEDYSPVELTVIAEDTSGNVTEKQLTIRFTWLREALTLEYGQTVSREDLLYAPEKDAALISDEDLEMINAAPVGEYEITSTNGKQTRTCHITVQDTQGPVLELKEYQTYPNHQVQISNFVVSATDISGEVTLTMVTVPDCSQVGNYTIVIEATDIHGNVTTGETTLYIATDFWPPVFYGVSNDLYVEKYSQPDFLAGVTAVDAADGTVEVTVDASRVNTDAAGTYVVIYTARDSSGNEATYRRKVHVSHDEKDTAALVESVAAGLENDPEKIRDYVRSSIRYSHSWGGEDPVWQGFVDKHGNCYVHALCLKAILDQKGYNSQLIWVTAKSHYWLIIEIEPGVWRHIDATPSDLHGRYSLMTDEQRYWTLSGRDWDREQWPACE